MLRKGGTRERNAEMRDHVSPTAHSKKATPARQKRPYLKTDVRSGIADLLKPGGRDLKRIRAHCVKHGPQLTGEIGSIRDVSLYEKLKKEFNGLMTSRMENPTVLRDKRNQRYTERSINKEAVSMLNVIIKEYLIDHPVNDMTHLAIIYQTAQDCHDMVAYKPPKATAYPPSSSCSAWTRSVDASANSTLQYKSARLTAGSLEPTTYSTSTT
ncbi:reverse transcriptase homolog [Babesia caballi]|uniref:Reverse transcriptase homolog n=1 Tax=Babesia caballi TaxID=5871 RepID=A0AAV4LPS0_BABCB|nr:reverse transcriptase homolog [Babesia caballi]